MSTRMRAYVRFAGGILSRARSLHGMGGLVALAGISILCLAQASRGRQQEEKTIRAKVVVAERFLLDSLGRDTRVSFGLRPAPGAAFTFFGAQGSRPLQFGVFNGTPSVSLERTVGETRRGMMLFVPDPGSPQFAINSDQETQLLLSVGDTAVPSVAFVAAGRDRMSLVAGARSAEQPSLPRAAFGLYGATGSPAIFLALSSAGPGMTLYDHEKHARTALTYGSRAGVGFQWFDRNRRPLLQLTVANEEASVILNDPATHVSKTLK